MKQTSHPNVTLRYCQVRSKLQYAVKDFVEKRIIFEHEGAVYTYFSTSANQDDEFAPVQGVERALTYYGVQRIHRESEGERQVIFESAMRSDCKLPVSNAVLKTLVPSGLKDWTTKLSAHLHRSLGKNGAAH